MALALLIYLYWDWWRWSAEEGGCDGARDGNRDGAHDGAHDGNRDGSGARGVSGGPVSQAVGGRERGPWREGRGDDTVCLPHGPNRRGEVPRVRLVCIAESDRPRASLQFHLRTVY